MKTKAEKKELKTAYKNIPDFDPADLPDDDLSDKFWNFDNDLREAGYLQWKHPDSKYSEWFLPEQTPPEGYVRVDKWGNPLSE